MHSQTSSSPTIEELAALQDLYGQEIQRVVTNFKKDPQERKTSEYLVERLRRLDASWALFEATDINIRNLPSPPLDHRYFSTEYYHKISKLYREFRQMLSDKIDQLVEETNARGETLSELDPIASQNITEPTNQPQQFRSNPDHRERSQTDPREKTKDQGTSKGAVPKFQPVVHAPIEQECIKLMKRQRAITQALTRLINSCETIDLSTETRAFFEIKINTINRYWNQIENYNHDLWERAEDPIVIGYDIQEYIQLEEKVQQLLVKFTTKLQQTSAGNPTNQTTVAGNTTASALLKLPKITLPKFDGDYAHWRQFCDLFSQMVHKQPLANCQKMWYLKTHLTGEAEKLIRHFTLSEDSYLTAWQMLHDRYENPRLLAASLINKLLNQPSHANDATSAIHIKLLHDTTKECLLGLENLGLPTTQWDPLLLHILYRKLDKGTHALYEQGLSNPKELQSVKSFLGFLETRFQSLEALGSKGRKIDTTTRLPRPPSTLASVLNYKSKCVACQGSHPLYLCKVFLKMAPNHRLQLVNKHLLCQNCLRKGHQLSKCTLRGCNRCNQKHNTLLHISQATKPECLPTNTGTELKTTAPSQKSEEGPISLATFTEKRSQGFVLLSTAIVRLTSETGQKINCRAVLDSGSQVNLITERVVRALGITSTTSSLLVQGIGNGRQQVNRRVNLQLQSRVNGFSTRLEALILDHIISPQPSQSLDVSRWSIPNNIQLADPYFNRSNRIDLLIGAEFFFHILAIGQIKLGANLPTLQNTLFGWIVAGRVDQAIPTTATCAICSEDEDLGKAVERFWKLEEAEKVPSRLSPQELKCENFFNQTVTRGEDGRFIVKLPFQDDPNKLGESSDIAVRRLLSIERRLSRQPEIQLQYTEFMKEYLRLHHMTEVDVTQISTPNYFLPHHYVLKPTSTSTKLRVVFNGSSKTSTNVALNDILATGPTIQDELFTILLRFRLPRYVFTADIEKMYRQVLVAEEDRKYQIILWRETPELPVKCFQLNTLTYGTTAAPYLATKCLQWLAKESSEQFPLGSRTLLRDFYMDDLMTGQDKLHDALEAQAQVTTLLQTAGFKLRKWCSNHKELLKAIPPEDRAVQLDIFDTSEEQISTLGLSWSPSLDEFQIKTQCKNSNKVTKRSVLSDIAHLFDPLGIISPVVVLAKLYLQQLWRLQLDWDAALPMELHSKWLHFREGLSTLKKIKIPRHMFKGKSPQSVQLHAFADASEKAYGAAIYLRSTYKDGAVLVNLLCAKSKVAPLKTITLPRLELCAAKLASELAQRVVEDLHLPGLKSFYWTDSEIVLAWIHSEASSYHTFVANRVATIHQLSIPEQWRHVGSAHNPADIVSRGLIPEKLASSSLWFYGPLFLHGSESSWPAPYKAVPTSLERKEIKTILAAANEAPNFIYSVDHRNNLDRWQRIIAYVLRFIHNTGSKQTRPEQSPRPSIEELDLALTTILKQTQREAFPTEIRDLARNGHVNPSSALSSLSPFLDDVGLLRVGGRLAASNLTFNAKHPILLPYAHQTTKIVMNHIHIKNLHVGPQSLLAITRQKFWPIKGKTIARSIVQNCVRCVRSKPKMLSQMMGNLPENRVQPARPFINAGVDFFGPCWIHYKQRGKRPQKSYVAVFCCFTTKATHFEVVSDLTTEAFIGALKRFTGRRGNVCHLYCDNATNFVGAKNKLQEISEAIYNDKSQEKIINFCNARSTEFHFIPPRAPHFGGLWEAAVKSAKHLLQPVLETAALTYEELETLMVEIEAILNSRPLTPLSSSPDDLSCLTPGHFLIGEPTTTVPDSQARQLNINLLQRWKLVSQLKNQFWHRWSKEYLSELQHRYKWKQQSPNAEPGMMVVIKEDNLPAARWRLGRIIKVITGDDGLARVADIKTSSGLIRRPIHKLAPLPIETDAKEEAQINQGSINTSTSRSSKRSHQGESSPTGHKRPFRGSAALLLTLCACFILPIQAQVNIKPFDTPPGLYFENVGNTYLVSNEWKLVIYYNTTTLWTELNSLKRGMDRLQGMCNLMKEWDQCGPIVAQFTNIMQEITTNNDLILHQSKSRSKRGAFDIIGNVANSLFGVLDSEYADHMSQVIQNLKENDGHLAELIKNQTSILDSTVNLIQRSQESTEIQLQHFDKYLNKSIEQLHTMNVELNLQKAAQSFTALALQLLLLQESFQKTQNRLLDVIIDTHHGKINPQLLNPKQLADQLTMIQENLPTSLRLPIRTDNLLKIYSLMTVESRITTAQMLFRIRLPLFANDDFELLHVIPVPFNLNNTFMKIGPVSEFIIISLHRDQYYPLSNSELSTCLHFDGAYVCNQRHPIYNKGANISTCELSVLAHGHFEKACSASITSSSPQWISMLNPNSWIYVRPTPTIISVLCNDEVEQKTIQQSGIITLNADCSIKDEHATINGHNVFSSKIKSGFTPSRNLSDFTYLKNQFNESLIYQPIKPMKNLSTEIEKLHNRINSLHLDVMSQPYTTHDIHQYSISYISLLAILSAAVYLTVRYIKGKTSTKNPHQEPHPVPRPRSIITDPTQLTQAARAASQPAFEFFV